MKPNGMARATVAKEKKGSYLFAICVQLRFATYLQLLLVEADVVTVPTDSAVMLCVNPKNNLMIIQRII
jgi:hypothetical protein